MGPGKMQASAKELDELSHVMFCAEKGFYEGTSKTIPTVIAGLMIMENKVDMEELERRVMDQLVKRVLRFRSTFKPNEKGWSCINELQLDEMDMEYHVQEDQREFNSIDQLKSQIVAQCKLDISKPLWKLQSIPNGVDGKPYLLFIASHSLGDGLALVAALRALTDGYTGPVRSWKQTSRASNDCPQHSLFDHAWAFWRGFTRPFLDASGPHDTKNSLKLDASEHVVAHDFVCLNDPLPLTTFKSIKHMVPGATINDLFLTLTNNMLKRQYEDSKDPCLNGEDVCVRAMFPVNIRPLDVDTLADEWFGNCITTSNIELCLNKGRLGTLEYFIRQTSLLKSSPDFRIRAFLQKAIKNMSLERMKAATRGMHGKFTLTTSNVLCSLDKRRVCGNLIQDVQFFTFANLSCYVGVSTYSENVHFSIVLNKGSGVNPNKLASYLREELILLEREARESFGKSEKPPAKTPQSLLYMFATLALFAFLPMYNSYF